MKLRQTLILIAFLIFLTGFVSVHGQHRTKEYNISFSKNLKSAGIDIGLENSDPNSFIGVSAYTLDLDADSDLYYRVKSHDSWSEWVPFIRFTEAPTPGRLSFEALPIHGFFTTLEFKAESHSEARFVFRLFLADPDFKGFEGEPKDFLKTDSLCACTLPTICYRDCWCSSGDCTKDYSATTTIPSHIIIHHSAGNTVSNNFAAVVAYYWDMHVNTNGWDDIGYNWLIDPNGVVYEGRGEGVLGAHFSCMNSGTSGICLIGNYEQRIPSDAMINSLIEFLGYEMCSKGLNPLEKTYHASSELDLYAISSHLDGNSATVSHSCASGTVCPGEHVYDLLPDIRWKVANLDCLKASGIDSQYLSLNKFLIYPNPGKGAFKLIIGYKENVGHYRIEIFDGLGQIISSQEGIPENHEMVFPYFNLYLIPGQYIVRVTTDHEVVSQRVIVN